MKNLFVWCLTYPSLAPVRQWKSTGFSQKKAQFASGMLNLPRKLMDHLVPRDVVSNYLHSFEINKQSLKAIDVS